MANFKIFCIGFDLPGSEFEYIPFDSDRTLLDADIILFRPTLGHAQFAYGQQYKGKLILSEESSHETKVRLNHWRSEIISAVKAGRLVIVYLTRPTDYFRYTGDKQYTDTGRSRTASNIVTEISSYEAVPNIKRVVSKSGSGIRLEKDGSYLASYWQKFAAISPYEVEIEGDFNRILLKSGVGDRIVGSAFHGQMGALILLPPLQYEKKKFLRKGKGKGENAASDYWTDAATKFGKQLLAELVSLTSTLRKASDFTPPPDWVSSSSYRLPIEDTLSGDIAGLTASIQELQERKAKLENQLESEGALRHLLFEQGKPLEQAVLASMTFFGFSAEPFSDGKSEFDGVFVAPEGRCLGEVEGRDNKSINIEKFSQLERNLHEDFAREGVTAYAKGILFGNACRLKPLDERSEFFTVKCHTAAERIGAALIRTPDLFPPVRYLKDNPENEGYAAECRKAIFSATGVVSFPPPPIIESSELVEEKKADITQNLSSTDRAED